MVVLAVGLVVPWAAAGHAQPLRAGAVRFEGGAEVTFEVGDARRLVDVVELRAAGDGSMTLINDVTMDDYLAGIAEMPPRWHGEALKAQAVAARTYAWRSVQRGTFTDRGYDICGTVDCQVFEGADAVADRMLGGRWQQAVAATSDEVLLDDEGRPILARYFSTSGGRTLPNELVFPSSGSFPYLVGVEDPDDEISPLHRWTVELTRAQFDELLAHGRTLSAAVPVADVQRRGDLGDPRAEIVVTGRDGTRAAVTAAAFRDFLSPLAASHYPDRFPGPRADGRGRLPATMPSNRFEVEVTADAVVIEGRGWGHGVGMGQYGAQGKALRGLAYDEILASYYNGLTPTRHEDVPDRVRVGLSVDPETTVRGDGPVRVVADGQTTASRALGRWRVRADDGALVIEPPPGHGEPLEVAPSSLAAPPTDGRDHVRVETSVNKPVELSLQVTDADGEPVLDRDLGVADPGDHAATWRLVDEDGARVPAGDYHLALVGVDAEQARDGEAVRVEVPAPAGRGDASLAVLPRWSLALLALGLLLSALVVIVVRHRRSP